MFTATPLAFTPKVISTRLAGSQRELDRADKTVLSVTRFSYSRSTNGRRVRNRNETSLLPVGPGSSSERRYARHAIADLPRPPHPTTYFGPTRPIRYAASTSHLNPLPRASALPHCSLSALLAILFEIDPPRLIKSSLRLPALRITPVNIGQ